MLNCQKCNFKILPKMRFALVKNFCPSCGGTLLSDLDSHEISVISKKLQTQDFIVNLTEQLNKDLVQNLVYDLSIFIKFDLKKEMGLSIVSSKADETPHHVVEVNQEEVLPEEGSSEDDERTKIPSKRIARVSAIADRQPTANSTRSLRRMSSYDDESGDEYSEDDVDSSEDSDEGLDDRVKRLKQLYKTSPTLKKFQGIARSDDI
jgi:hypothetical protein